MVYSVYDSEFSEYGFIAEGYPLHGLRAALGILKLPDKNGYVPHLTQRLAVIGFSQTCLINGVTVAVYPQKWM